MNKSASTTELNTETNIFNHHLYYLSTASLSGDIPLIDYKTYAARDIGPVVKKTTSKTKFPIKLKTLKRFHFTKKRKISKMSDDKVDEMGLTDQDQEMRIDEAASVEATDQPETIKDTEKVSKVGKFVRKLSLNRFKKRARKSQSLDLLRKKQISANTSPSSVKRWTPEGANLSISETSLVNIPGDTVQLMAEPKKKIDQLQITITGKKTEKSIEQINDVKSNIILQGDGINSADIRLMYGSTSHSDTANNIEIDPTSLLWETKTEGQYIQNGIDGNSVRLDETSGSPQKRPFDITDSRNAIMVNDSNITGETEQISAGLFSSFENITIANNKTVSTQQDNIVTESKGAIRKTFDSAKSKKERNLNKKPNNLMRNGDSLERGRRFPRPHNIELRDSNAKAIVADVHTPVKTDYLPSYDKIRIYNEIPTGIVLMTDALKSVPFTSVDSKSLNSYEDDVRRDDHLIEFEVGKLVSDPSRLNYKTKILSSDYKQLNSDEFSSIDTNKSNESELRSDVSRRKLYVDPIIGHPLIDDENIHRLDSFGGGFTSEDYSLDTTDYLSMPAFGDLIMQEDQMASAPIDPGKNEYLYKILVIGDLGTGKTSIIKRYVHHFFSQSYRATIGVDFALKVLQWNDNTIVRLQLWDIAGQERFGNMTRVYYKEAVGAFIVYDVTRHQTFDAVLKWKQDLDSKVQMPDGSPVPCVLLGNKSDQPKCKELEDNDRIEQFAKNHGFAGWFETSAKENINIDEAAKALVTQILAKDNLTKNDQYDLDRIDLETDQPNRQNSCSC